MRVSKVVMSTPCQAPDGVFFKILKNQMEEMLTKRQTDVRHNQSGHTDIYWLDSRTA